MENLILLLCTLVQIPSPSLKEAPVADKIIEVLADSGIEAHKDSYGNVIGTLEANVNGKKTILLSSHMDVVGDDSPIHIVEKDGYLMTDKTRTLGADDKAGVAAAITFVKELKENNIPHGKIELVFTRDEENGLTGANNLDFSQFESEYVVVIDADKTGDILTSGASFVKLNLAVNAFKGGHSGNDIDDKTRLNAVKLIAELMNEIPQGVYYKNETGVITSINAGAILGGGVENSIKDFHTEKEIVENAMTNLINTDAYAIYSLRSADRKKEEELISKVRNIVDKFNRKYDGLAKADLKVEYHMQAFEKTDDETLIKAARKAGKQIGLKINEGSFHAGAETHIYANKQNKYGKKFKPVLLGVADIDGMHSKNEQINIESYKKGYEFLKTLYLDFVE
ncbi:M20/M25/M40 family metallo-hydrolase [bacterium]|nr:M20/M25/M40 family metallo-hydrolase [bacterium]